MYYNGKIVNCSEKGMLIKTRVSLPLHSTFDLFVYLEDEIIRMPVRVVRLAKKGDFYDEIAVEIIEPSIKYIKFLQAQIFKPTFIDTGKIRLTKV
jgi:hypothetical protein